MMPDGFAERRSVVGGLLFGALAVGSARAAGSNPLVPDEPKQVARVFKKLAYATDDRIGFWWLRATRYALVETELIPLWDMHVGSGFQVRDLTASAYEVAYFQSSFYTDLKSGALLRRFDNPFTGKTIDMPHVAPTRSVVSFDETGRTDRPTGVLASLSRRAAPGPVWIENDKVWVRGDVILSGEPGADGKRPIRVNDLTTYFGSLRDVEDASNRMPAAGQIFSDINIWPPWLGMGDHKGDYYSRGLGFKVATFEAMPSRWKDLMRSEYPEAARDIPRLLRG